MAQGSVLFRFRIELSDIDRDVYDSLDLRVALHPSESRIFLVTRVLAFALNWEPGLEFAPGGISDTEAPAIHARGTEGQINLWIEIGNPSPRKLHRAMKSARRVRVFTHKAPEPLVRELHAEKIHRMEALEIVAVDPRALEALAETLQRDNQWTVIHNVGQLLVTQGERSFDVNLRSVSTRF